MLVSDYFSHYTVNALIKEVYFHLRNIWNIPPLNILLTWGDLIFGGYLYWKRSGEDFVSYALLSETNQKLIISFY